MVDVLPEDRQGRNLLIDATTKSLWAGNAFLFCQSGYLRRSQARYVPAEPVPVRFSGTGTKSVRVWRCSSLHRVIQDARIVLIGRGNYTRPWNTGWQGMPETVVISGFAGWPMVESNTPDRG